MNHVTYWRVLIENPIAVARKLCGIFAALLFATAPGFAQTETEGIVFAPDDHGNLYIRGTVYRDHVGVGLSFDRTKIQFTTWTGTIFQTSFFEAQVESTQRIYFFGGPGDDEFGFMIGDIDTIVNPHTETPELPPFEVYGGSGNDRLSGFSKNDILVGGDGNDYFRPGKGDDLVFGGAGDDEQFHAGPDPDFDIFCGGGQLRDIGGNSDYILDGPDCLLFAQPIVGNWDGVIGDEQGYYLPFTSTFLRPGASQPVVQFGLSFDWPVVGDWDGDGIDTPGVFRSGTFFLDVGGAGWTGEQQEWHRVRSPGRPSCCRRLDERRA